MKIYKADLYRDLKIIIIYTLILFFLFFLGLSFTASAAVSSGGENITKQFEGFSSKSYWDVSGFSIGYGFRCTDTPEVNCNSVISRQTADLIFKKIYRTAQLRAIKFVGKKHWPDLTESEKIAVTDLSYNLGNRLFQFKKFRAALLAHNHKKIKEELKTSKWYRQTGKRGKKLVNLLTGGKNGK
jgi:GH24 family phage-related lysozyme (muramidase)